MFARLWNSLFRRRPKKSVSESDDDLSATPGAVAESDPSTVPSSNDDRSIEELCELRDGMTHEEMRAHLAVLYRRHNRAASSLNPELRAHAERMLDAIVEARHRYLEKDPY